MPLKVRCVCGASYRVPANAAGRKFRCKKCRATIVVPSPQKSRKAAARQPDEDHLLHQLFDDDDEFGEADWTAPPPRPARTRRPPAPEQRKREPRQTQYDPVRLRLPKVRPRAAAAMALVAIITLGFFYAPVAWIIAMAMSAASCVLVIVGWLWGNVLAWQDGLGHRLLCRFFPPYLLIYMLLRLDDARGAWYCLGGGLLLGGAAVLLAKWLVLRHGLEPLPFF